MATDEAVALRVQFKIRRIWPTYQEAIQPWALVNSRGRHDRNSAGQKMHEVTDQSDMVEDKFRCASKGIIVEGPKSFTSRYNSLACGVEEISCTNYVDDLMITNKITEVNRSYVAGCSAPSRCDDELIRHRC